MAQRGNDMEQPAREPDSIELLEADEQELALDILNELHDAPGDNTYRLRVSRVTGPNIRGSHEPFLFEIDATAVSGMQERLSKEYGNGTYRVRVMKNNRIIRRYDIVIETPRISTDTSQIKQLPAPEITGGLAQVLNDMNSRQMVFMEQVLQRLQAPQVQPLQADPFTMMEKMSTIFANMRSPNDGAGGTALIEAFKSGIEIVGNMTGKGETGLMDIAKDLINSPLLGKLMDGAKTVPPMVRPGFNPGTIQPMQNLVSPTQAKPPTSMLGDGEQVNGYVAAEANFVPGMSDNLEAYIPMLLQKAERQADPGLYAEILLDNLPPQVIDIIIADPQFLERLIVAYPAVGNHRPWFQETLAQMKTQAQTEQETVSNVLKGMAGQKPASSDAAQGPTFGNIVDTRGGSGNAGNPQTHAGNRSGVQKTPGNP